MIFRRHLQRMIYFDRRFNRVWFRHYLCYVDGYTIEWRQNVNRNEKVVGIGWFNRHKNHYKYEKKGYCGAMHRRIAKLDKRSKE